MHNAVFRSIDFRNEALIYFSDLGMPGAHALAFLKVHLVTISFSDENKSPNSFPKKSIFKIFFNIFIHYFITALNRMLFFGPWEPEMKL